MPSLRLPHPPRLQAPRVRRGHVRLLLALALVVVGLGGAWLALRDSGLVAVDEVTVTGASGPDADAIRSALRAAGQDMTTLHVRPAVLTDAVARYPVVQRVAVQASFPHGLRVAVTQHVPVAALVGGGRTVPVAADGTLLPDTAAAGLPQISLELAPAGDVVTDRPTRSTIRLLAVAPAPLRARVTTAFRGPDGLAVHLANGPAVRFGPGSRLAAKWAALAAVLASPESRGATAIDVRVPEHPAAAGLVQKAAQRG